MLILIAVLVGLSVTLISFELLRARPDPIGRRIRSDRDEPATSMEDRTGGSAIQRIIAPGFRRTGTQIARLLPQNLLRSIRQLLVAADEPWSLPGFLAVWLLSTGLGALLWLYIALSAGSLSGLQMSVIGFAIMPLAIALPYARIRSKARARQRAIVRALPDALDLLVTSVEAGMGVDAAFGLVTEKTEGPLSETFAQYLKEVGLGRSRRDALTAVAERAAVPDLIEIANGINQGEQLGTPVGDVLRTQADDLRALRRERAQTKAQRAPVLMTIPLATCFLPAMVAVVIVPSILSLVDFVGDLGGV